ncbi:MAG: FliA/WhiG family RNA polymerase sigma factor [Sporichthyaceae bacterium]
MNKLIHVPEQQSAVAVADREASRLEDLWRTYKLDNDDALRERLILHYAPLVKYVAGRMGSGLPRNVDLADCMSVGVFGLIDAIEKFDPERGIAFEPYAISRIRGAILDELRAQDWIPRSVRARAKDVQRAWSELENKLGRSPSEPELAEELGLSAAALHKLFGQLAAVNVLALDELLGSTAQNPDAINLGETLADLDAPDPAHVVESAEVRRLLVEALGTLGEREQTLVRLYYFEGFTLAEIGSVLGVTESRVCQMHTKAVLALRARLR